MKGEREEGGEERESLKLPRISLEPKSKIQVIKRFLVLLRRMFAFRRF